MALTADEKLLLEGVAAMLTGIEGHAQEHRQQGERERGLEYLHGQINEMFTLKSADLTHHTGACQAFAKVHSYKYIDDPTFIPAMLKEMTAQGIPEAERERAIGLVPTIIKELRADERDGFSPELDSIMEIPG